jgi:predicted RNA-binding protein with PUA-like domain
MNHWLVKSEPETYSWDNLVKDKRTNWNGVRNFQAAANMKAMKKGDRVMFYHSGESRSIVGVAEVVKEYYPDPSDDTGRFGMVDIAAVMPIKRPVTLSEIKAEKKLADFKLVRQGRLSVVPVSEAEWKLLTTMGQTKA